MTLKIKQVAIVVIFPMLLFPEPLTTLPSIMIGTKSTITESHRQI